MKLRPHSHAAFFLLFVLKCNSNAACVCVSTEFNPNHLRCSDTLICSYGSGSLDIAKYCRLWLTQYWGTCAHSLKVQNLRKHPCHL
ncbi:hypothetical protein GDO81_016215 [Engystomops pustulosus]|uniref:Secreted protein n=1 Tax=Engystomops pustulosus TaxID=76066 RepID=A0AAV7AUW6_ENGPU|nr:hypothetical protein GDO81_016215 [Engystomops pustulosus]